MLHFRCAPCSKTKIFCLLLTAFYLQLAACSLYSSYGHMLSLVLRSSFFVRSSTLPFAAYSVSDGCAVRSAAGSATGSQHAFSSSLTVSILTEISVVICPLCIFSSFMSVGAGIASPSFSEYQSQPASASFACANAPSSVSACVRQPVRSGNRTQ